MHQTLHTVLLQDQAALEITLGLDASSARIEVQCLLQQVLQVGRAYFFAHPERVLNATEYAAYQALLKRRLAGEPIAYILGEREFFGLKLSVTSATLIPRPDTELLVELALQNLPSPSATLLPERTTSHSTKPASGQVAGYLPQAGEGQGRGHVLRILDMGTGSGAIALALAHQRPDVEMWACDASAAALAVANSNAQRLAIVNVRFVESNWFSAFGGQRFDLIVSNPPYIAATDEHLAQGDVRFEPLSALASGADGLDDIRRIISQAGAHLQQGGWLIFEHGYDQAARVRELLQQGGFSAVFSARDLAGIERCSGGQLLTL
jgi:release factor glutamine methyltransferase